MTVINQAIKEFSDENAKALSEHSHGDIPRKETPDMEIIKYELVFKRSPEYSIVQQEKKLKENIALLRSTHAFDYLLMTPICMMITRYKYGDIVAVDVPFSD